MKENGIVYKINKIILVTIIINRLDCLLLQILIYIFFFFKSLSLLLISNTECKYTHSHRRFYFLITCCCCCCCFFIGFHFNFIVLTDCFSLWFAVFNDILWNFSELYVFVKLHMPDVKHKCSSGIFFEDVYVQM